MQTSKLLDNALIEPALDQGAVSRYLISGFATATLAYGHIRSFAEKSIQARTNVIVGIVKKDSKAIVAFSDSANYTLTGFRSAQIEVLNDTFPKNIPRVSTDCSDPSIDEPTRLD